jgi:hypothetical protein
VSAEDAKPRKPRTKTNSDTWKAVELGIARLLGGERVPVTGRTMGSAPDIDHPDLAIEVKHGKSIPKLLQKALAQAVAAQGFYLKRNKGDRVPVAIFHPEHARYDESFLIVRIRDLRALQRVRLPEDDL